MSETPKHLEPLEGAAQEAAAPGQAAGPSPAPEIPEPPVPEEHKPPLSEQKKNALLRYMAILFGVAFLLVLLSFLIQMRDSRETISDLSQSQAGALQKAEQLQNDNQKLTADVAALRDETERLTAEYEEVSALLEAAHEETDELETRLDSADTGLRETRKAYDLLMTAQYAREAGDTEKLKQALSDLAPLKERLSADGLKRYEILAGSLTAEN